MREIKGYEGLYAVSRDGIVYSLQHGPSRRKGEMKPYIHGPGYLRLNLYDAEGNVKKHYVHRLVADAYVPNPVGLPHVNHINADKTDNRVANLEWCTARHNIEESRRLGLQKKDLKTIVKCKATGAEKEYPTIKAASIALTGSYHALSYQVRVKGREFDYGSYAIKVVIKFE